MTATIVLFDVDGTLITSAGAGRRALVRLFAERLGREDAFDQVFFGGMTDRAILRAGLRACGLPADGDAMQELFDAYLAILQDEVDRAEGYRLHEGVPEVLDRLESRAGLALGLGTGNIAEGARIKLQRVGIWERFPFGGFGSDHEQRDELLRVGARRGAERLGHPLARCRVVVVGDTPKDVAAAQAIGAESVAVSTGFVSAEELSATGATEVVPRLDASRLLADL